MPKLTFNNRENLFYIKLKANVDKYFKENKLKKTGNWTLYSKTLVLISSAVIIYAVLLFVKLPLAVLILLFALMGFILASIGFNIMHDANHGAYSDKKWVNEMLGLTLNALGGNSFIWKVKHNLHHAYTSVDGIDDDIAKSPLMRQCASQKWVPAHRFQHIYVLPVYALSCVAWITILDFSKYFTQKVLITPIHKMSIRQHLIFWMSKTLFVLFYIVIPIYCIGAVNWAIGFSVMQVVLGLILAFVFQMAHVVEDTTFESIETEDKVIDTQWAVHQVKSTANFAPGNRFINWYVGGLNYQIEHHLFPKISHVHYPAISEIVHLTCREFNLPYMSFPTMGQAIASHFRLMKQMGKKPVA